MAYAIHNHDFDNAEFVQDEEFGFQIQQLVLNVPSKVSIPRNTWKDEAKYEKCQIEVS